MGKQKTDSPRTRVPRKRRREWEDRNRALRLPRGDQALAVMSVRDLIVVLGSICCWCRCETLLNVAESHPRRATIEHILPKSKGGTNHVDNLRVACRACNHARGNDLGPPKP